MVGVNCSHGVNRTGYFVSRFLIQKSGLDQSLKNYSFYFLKIPKNCYQKHKKIPENFKKLLENLKIHQNLLEMFLKFKIFPEFYKKELLKTLFFSNSGLDSASAIQAFTNARGHPIDHAGF